MSHPFTSWCKRLRRSLTNPARRDRSSPPGSKPRRTVLALEVLEDRLAPALFTVNSLADLSIAGGINPNTGAIVGTNGTVTLRSAIQAANMHPGGNTIQFLFPGTYSIALPGANTGSDATGAFAILPNGGNLTLVNNSGGNVIVNGNHLDRVFDINPNFDPNNPTPAFTVTLQGFTITNGLASPGDMAAGSGGGIRDQGNASLTLTNIVLTNNIATADGGRVSMENGVSVPWKLTVNNSLISNNHAGDAGGGIETDGSGKVVINTGTVITGNTCVNQGAGIWLDDIADPNNTQVLKSATLTVIGTLISNNDAQTGPGGGIGNAGNGAVTILASTIENNTAGMIGGGFADTDAQGILTVVGSLFLNNVAVGDGGGIYEGGPTTSLTTTEIAGNASGGRGGGLFIGGFTLFMQDCTIANNTAAGDTSTHRGGGGLELAMTGSGAQGSTIIDTTITGNRALNHGVVIGGGIDAFTMRGTLLLSNDTINGNFADNGGGIVSSVFGQLTVQNTIVAQNTIAPLSNAVLGIDVLDLGLLDGINATILDLGGNVIGVAGDGNVTFVAGTTQTGTKGNPLNPLLAPLGNNGGPTLGAPGATLVLQTEALQTGSPAIGHGVFFFQAPAYDERGQPTLVNGGIDVGAVSAVVPLPQLLTQVSVKTFLISQKMVNGVLTTTYTVNSTLDTHLPIAGTLTLRAALDLANATSGNKIIQLVVPGDYAITLPGANTGTNASGAFTILPSGGSVTIVNASGGPVTVDGNHLDRVFDINPNFDPAHPSPAFTVTLQGFTITNGQASPGDGATGSGGGIRDQGNASLTLNNIILTNNLATADGGGVSMENLVSVPWTLTVNNSLISNNHAGDAGGGIETDGSGKLFINTGTVITGNTCVNQGAGIWLDAIGVVASVKITNPGDATFGALGFPTVQFTSVDGNGSGAQGVLVVDANGVPIDVTITNPGAGYDMPPTVSFTFPYFTPNITAVATLAFQSATLTVTGALLSGNDALTGPGGGIGNAGSSTVTLLNSTIQNNFSGNNGGGFDDENGFGTLVVTNSLFLNNRAVGDGGGILESGPTTTITCSEVAGNISGLRGGGIFDGGTTLVILNSTIANNIAAGQDSTNEGGGGIELQTTGTSSITNSTITGNRALMFAGVAGGGIDAAVLLGSVALLNDTINANFANMGGGIFYGNMGTTFSLQNTILAQNFIAAGGTGVDAVGKFLDLGGNLIGVTGDANSGFTTGTTQTGTLAHPLNPLLGPLGNNGGPILGTPGAALVLETELLEQGSTALNRGIKNGAPVADERGFKNGKFISIGAVNM
jgi:hypothetical protein